MYKKPKVWFACLRAVIVWYDETFAAASDSYVNYGRLIFYDTMTESNDFAAASTLPRLHTVPVCVSVRVNQLIPACFLQNLSMLL